MEHNPRGQRMIFSRPRRVVPRRGGNPDRAHSVWSPTRNRQECWPSLPGASGHDVGVGRWKMSTDLLPTTDAKGIVRRKLVNPSGSPGTLQWKSIHGACA